MYVWFNEWSKVSPSYVNLSGHPLNKLLLKKMLISYKTWN